MFDIKGTVNTAVCFASVIEPGAVDQIRTLCSSEVSRGSRIRIMPDAHAGRGCTIGTTMTVTDRICPNLVGVDIGCGMYTVRLENKADDLAALDAACHFIPSGKAVWEGRQESFDLTALRCYRNLRDAKRLERSLGTLGGGNHFIELDEAEDGTQYLIIHSGSRNLGKQTAEYYQALAVDLRLGKDKLFEMRKQLIRDYKAAGRRAEIQAALNKLNESFHARTLDMPAELCWLYGEYLSDYLHDAALCTRFARRNREKMAEIILEKCGLTAAHAFHTVHNYIDETDGILRKGAISAHTGEPVLIPINMRDGSVLAVGRGNAEWNFSAPHGAGRILSRSAARDTLRMEDYRAAMAGIYTTSVCEETLDEAPMAYKSLSGILGDIRTSVEVQAVLHPVFNFKASGGDPWKKAAQA